MTIDEAILHEREGYNTGYNKAIDDFVKDCDKQFAIMYGQRYIDMRNIKEIAEQLKGRRII